MKLLNDMALFVEVIKANSFRGAAEALTPAELPHCPRTSPG